MNIQELANQNHLFVAILKHEDIEFKELINIAYNVPRGEFDITYKGDDVYMSEYDSYTITVPSVLSFMWSQMIQPPNCGDYECGYQEQTPSEPKYIDECRQLVRSGHRFAAVKLWRENTGATLRTAVAKVDTLKH
jgi:hypothetical protein